MGIELEWVKKNNSKTEIKLNKFFLALFNLNKKSVCKTSNERSAYKKIEADFAQRKVKQSKATSFNLPAGFLGAIAIPFSTSIERVSKQFKKMLFAEKGIDFFPNLNSIRHQHVVFLTFSVSFFKSKYPQSWKTIFVHLSEKSNLLVRSDYNTGFFLPKILQTTTI